jgi:uncharacterized membrane protein
VDSSESTDVRDVSRHRAARRTAIAAALGAVASGIVAAFVPWQATVLVGWSTAATMYCTRVWFVSRSMDARTTELHATSEDDSRFVADVTLLGACVASLVAVGLALVKAAQTGGTGQAVYTGIGVLSVVMSWVLVHTVFTLRYGRLYYEHRDGIDFHNQSDPTYRDFAYVAFTIGMTYQVSDTELSSRTIRSTALRHALLSYLFGAVIIAMTINVVAGLLK